MSDKAPAFLKKMSRRSTRHTLQERNENAPEQKKQQRKRKGELTRRIPTTSKKQHYEIQNRCFDGDVSPSVLIETPQKEVLEETTNLSGFKRFRFKNLFVKPSPLPCLSWANSDDVWIKMLNKELKYVHDKSFIQQHPTLLPKMRGILLDWLMEVSEVYNLHRETFYLAQDIFDRFMLTQKDIGKEHLQLIGVTALFIASKIEEDIIAKELVILKALNWSLCPETIVSWLKLYSQVDSLKDEVNFLVPQFSQETYIQVTQLLDLCILDIESLDYQYGVLAAAAFCLTWDSISNCVRWMNPFAQTVREWPRPQLKDFKKVPTEDRHNIQTHVDYLAMLSKTHERKEDFLERMSPVAVMGILTPPKSTEKPAND
ncbi:hypothetical protein DNTS_022600 [Danionella cerebrum]|uniref:Uncharacterized protein n=1 Tax=Danionella cerebrum TaxID=2873325 RepID=A0A553QA34_9TELE|nr:hypothetical protein DNTS_022600 [Danionella translucida]